MARVDVGGGLHLGWREWGKGEVTVVFIHGNLASKEWLELAAPYFPSALRVVGIDWRGCGDSDRPKPDADYANYSMAQHAKDMLAALDALKIPHCHLATHSTGGIIATRMLLEAPKRFGRVLHLDPVSPAGIEFNSAQIELFRAMSASRDVTRAVMATAATSLFDIATLAQGSVPRLLAAAAASGKLFEKLIDQTFTVSEGIWIGTPHNLTREHESGELKRRMGEIRHEQLVVWGELDAWIARDDLVAMAKAMPDCRLVTVPGIGHSMNVEAPQLYAGYFGAWFGGLDRKSSTTRT